MRHVDRETLETPECPLGCLAGPFFDGELTPREARGYLEHLFHCPVCRAELRAVRRLSQLIRSSGSLEPWVPGPEDVPDEEAARAEAAERARRALSRLRPRPSPSSAPLAGATGGSPVGRR